MPIDGRKRSPILKRIAAANRPVSPGRGFGSNHFVPAFTIVNRSLAARLRQKLLERNIDSEIRGTRLVTQFFVNPENLVIAMQIREEFLSQNPDTILPPVTRDFDSVLLLSPIILFAALFSAFAPGFPKCAWIGILTSGISTMYGIERVNRHRRRHFGMQLGTRDLFALGTIVAINTAVWRAVL